LSTKESIDENNITFITRTPYFVVLYCEQNILEILLEVASNTKNSI